MAPNRLWQPLSSSGSVESQVLVRKPEDPQHCRVFPAAAETQSDEREAGWGMWGKGHLGPGAIPPGAAPKQGGSA